MTKKNLADLRRRLIVSSVAVVIISGLMYFSNYTLVKGVFVFLVSALAGVGVWEYGQLARAKELSPAVKSMIVISIAEILAFFITYQLDIFPQFPSIILALGAVVFFLIHFRETNKALFHVAIEFFGVCYVAVPLSFMLAVLYPVSITGTSWDGKWWLAYLILVTKVTDVGAYFVGRLFGKRKLAPLLSPKKTVEGAIAGLVCAVFMSLGISYIGYCVESPLFDLPLLPSIILGFCIGVAGQVGDLAESLLKRDADVKDSNTLPGLGGVLDMVDSLLLTAPIVYFYLQLQV